MSDLTYKTLETKLTAEPGERAVVARISTADIDRDGDVVLPNGMDASDFAKNPVVLLQHDSGALPIGTATELRPTHKAVMGKVAFAERPAAHPPMLEWLPDTVLSLFQQGVLRAFSIGFMILNARPPNRKDIERYGDGVHRVINEWKLLEFSVVAIPANQNALATAVSKSWLREGWNLAGQSPRRLQLPERRVVIAQ